MTIIDKDESWTDRTELLLGSDKMQRLRDAHVLVVGVGGVGAYAAEMLCRAGVGEMTLIDADTVQPTNINRQLPATHATLGRPKVEVLAERFRDINPEIKVHAWPVYLTEELKIENSKLKVLPPFTHCHSEQREESQAHNNHEILHSVAFGPFGRRTSFQDDMQEGTVNSQFSIFNFQFDFIVDAIDTIAPKCALITEALRRRIPIVSSMGAGAKSDITQIRFADLWDTYHCGLAKAVRTRLKKAGIRQSLPVVFSTEQADRRAVITVEGEQNKKSTTGTISYMPAVFGCYLAEYVIRKL